MERSASSFPGGLVPICIVVVLMLAGCKCREPVKPVEPARPSVRAMTTWLPHEVAAVPEDVYGVPAWSKVFALAFERRVQVGVPSCAVDGGCLGRDPLAMRAEPMVADGAGCWGVMSRSPSSVSR